MSFSRFLLVRLGWALLALAWLRDLAAASEEDRPRTTRSALAIGFHFLVDVAVGGLDKDLRAEWPVAGMPVRT